MAGNGCKEITLLGQNVNSYNGLAYSVERIAYSKNLNAKRYPLNAKTSNFAKLLERLNKVNGIARIRFMTSHPKDASPELFRAMRDLDKVCEHLHLPLQSGSDRILKLMNRGYTAKKYSKLIEDYRKLIPEGSVTTDFVVGFPSETKRDFEKTLILAKKIRFDGAFMFKYSPRPPAKAAKLKDGISREEKERRLEALLRFQCEMSRRRNEPLAGKTVEVLVDGRNEKAPSFLTGRTRSNKTVIFEGGKSLIGKLVNIKVESVTPHTLKGKMV